jgi:hypothetical protein
MTEKVPSKLWEYFLISFDSTCPPYFWTVVYIDTYKFCFVFSSIYLMCMAKIVQMTTHCKQVMLFCSSFGKADSTSLQTTIIYVAWKQLFVSILLWSHLDSQLLLKLCNAIFMHMEAWGLHTLWIYSLFNLVIYFFITCNSLFSHFS